MFAVDNHTFNVLIIVVVAVEVTSPEYFVYRPRERRDAVPAAAAGRAGDAGQDVASAPARTRPPLRASAARTPASG